MSIDAARAILRPARRVLILTGAGISAESGVPTFRDAGGVWSNYRAEDLATPEAFARDPRFVWEWYEMRREAIRRCAPNEAHHSIAWYLASHDSAVLATQNVDGLHAAAANEAGAPDPIELHGSIFRLRCTRCDWSGAHREPLDTSSRDALPTCPVCHSLARPAVTWFGEALPEDAIAAASTAAENADACIVIGTSALVYPAAGLPHLTAESGGAIIEVNPEDTPLTPSVTVTIRATAVAAVPALLGRDLD